MSSLLLPLAFARRGAHNLSTAAAGAASPSYYQTLSSSQHTTKAHEQGAQEWIHPVVSKQPPLPFQEPLPPFRVHLPPHSAPSILGWSSPGSSAEHLVLPSMPQLPAVECAVPKKKVI
jgi:hypothetical protein